VPRLFSIAITPRSPEALGSFETENVERLTALRRDLRKRLSGRVVWHVSSSRAGGGVPEALRSSIAYARGNGIDARWLVIQAPHEFSLLVKRLVHALQGFGQRSLGLGEDERGLYEKVLHENGAELVTLARPGDLVVLHDPQTAGLIPHAATTGAHVIWQCHAADGRSGGPPEEAWHFLSGYLGDAERYIFTFQSSVPPLCDEARTTIIPPILDPLSPKNQELAPETVHAILAHAGLVSGPVGRRAPAFVREDGSPGRVDRCADVIRLGGATSPETPMVLQVSRWDRIKDPVGVLLGFAQLVDGGAGDAELVLAGPNVHAVPDDPEAPDVFIEVSQAWRDLPHGVRRRVHLACLPMADAEENGVLVNALQRRATVVTQKSLGDGFGWTVAEAMWKGRPVVASAIGGIPDQIEDQRNGLLVDDPEDVGAFSEALSRILREPELGAKLGSEARASARNELRRSESLVRWWTLVANLDEHATRGRFRDERSHHSGPS
jgi:trehalose synthase